MPADQQAAPAPPGGCGLCGHPVTLLHRSHPGYRAGTSFSIYGCAACDLHFAWPLSSAGELYDLIYSQVDRVPGYSRYAAYARQVGGAADPLAFLAKAEDVYWAVARVLRDDPRSPKLSVLDVGSGRGYLAFALRAAGYDATGLDLSPVAVDAANAAYGPHYVCGDVRVLAETSARRYDYVVMTELIEHVEDPHAMVDAALRLLRPGGGLILTTPNKSAAAAHVLWETDLPPVHLWWFSEQSLRALGTAHRCQVTLLDFSEYPPDLMPEQDWTKISAMTPTRTSVLDRDGHPAAPVRDDDVARPHSWKERLRRGIPAPVLDAIRDTRRRLKRGRARRATQCAVLRPLAPTQA